MSLWRAFLRWFGLHREARVQISAPGIEVTLAGDPEQVRALMGVIRTELERKARRDRRMNKAASSQVVRPTELDEMDSPYALPEAVVMPVPEDDRPDDRGARLLAMTARESDTWPPIMSAEDVHLLTAPEAPRPEDGDEASEPPPLPTSEQRGLSAFSAEDVESMQTALTAHPGEGPTPPVLPGVRAASPADIDTLEVDRKKNRITRPLHPAVAPDLPDPLKSQ